MTEEMVAFVNKQLGQDLTPIFDQYLRRADAAGARADVRREGATGVVSLERRGARLRDADSGRRSGEVADDSAGDVGVEVDAVDGNKDQFKVATDLYYVNVAVLDSRGHPAEVGVIGSSRRFQAFLWIAAITPRTNMCVAGEHRAGADHVRVSLVTSASHSSRSARFSAMPGAQGMSWYRDCSMAPRWPRLVVAAPGRVYMRRQLFAFIFLLAFAAPSFAQTLFQGRIDVTVVDAQGRTVPGRARRDRRPRVAEADDRRNR